MSIAPSRPFWARRVLGPVSQGLRASLTFRRWPLATFRRRLRRHNHPAASGAKTAPPPTYVELALPQAGAFV